MPSKTGSRENEIAGGAIPWDRTLPRSDNSYLENASARSVASGRLNCLAAGSAPSFARTPRRPSRVGMARGHPADSNAVLRFTAAPGVRCGTCTPCRCRHRAQKGRGSAQHLQQFHRVFFGQERMVVRSIGCPAGLEVTQEIDARSTVGGDRASLGVPRPAKLRLLERGVNQTQRTDAGHRLNSWRLDRKENPTNG